MGQKRAGRRTALIVWALGPVFELPGVAALTSVSTEVAADAAFGSPGTQITLFAALLATLVGVVVAWHPDIVPARARQVVVVLLAALAGLTGLLALGFFAGGARAVVGILLAHSALAIAMIAAFAYRSTKPRIADRQSR
jgi:hypothetical protein